ncbi:MAG TPA: UTP--glucose-1-phosphate uridylyltransferase, partial [Verrucomicrobiota bacterium]|nr:UTP--glucose-1-phosphate uridylyltransferase [Verrucomicrobiota bacterium]
VRGNQWMFRMGHPADQPLRLRPELLQRAADGTYPILRELTPVRMDLTHSAWSDIFFLGMDYPEGAKVLNISVDLGVHGRDAVPRPPVSAWLRVLDEPVLRLTSVDLGATADLTALGDVFDFAKDYLGLLKAAVIAAGLVPPGIEGSGQSLADLLTRIVGPGRGLEIVSCVNDIPKGSRLAVSTNLLGSLISVCMRATGQTSGDGGTGASAGPRPAGALPAAASGLTGPLSEADRRIVLARALLGEWLGGSGGGWQDSGGVWPGIKLITGAPATADDPESGISRGRLMPRHHVFSRDEIPESARQALMDSLVVVHGGMAQNVGPILEMVTEKYLLRSAAEWRGRQEALGVLDEVIAALKRGDIRALGAATTRNFTGPIQAIIPWASTYFTEQLIGKCRREFGEDFWGFWMLGGMSGGGMGFIFAPQRKAAAQTRLREIMLETKRELGAALPFAMDPVVFDYAINEHGTVADLLAGDDALMPPGYYALTVPRLLRTERSELPASRRAELDKLGAAARTKPELRGLVQTLFDVLLPRGRTGQAGGATLAQWLEENGFDRAQHEQIRAELR